MANGKLPPHIIELDDSVDAHDSHFDADLVALRVAALKAQNTAIQYEVQTTAMQASISASYRETRHQSPPLGASSPRQHHEQEQERHEEREWSSCDEHGKTPNLRTESPELGSPDGHYDFNRVVQTGFQECGHISSKRTSSPFSSSESGDDRLPAVHETVPGRPCHTKTAPSEPRHKATLSAASASAQKRRRLWMKNISRKKARTVEDVAPATKMARLGRQSKSDIKEEHILLAAVFRAEIYPLIKSACSQNQSIRSQDQAHSASRAVRNNAVHIAYQSWRLTCVSSSHRSPPRL